MSSDFIDDAMVETVSNILPADYYMTSVALKAVLPLIGAKLAAECPVSPRGFKSIGMIAWQTAWKQAAARIRELTGAPAPDHTDLMISPEAIDEVLVAEVRKEKAMIDVACRLDAVSLYGRVRIYSVPTGDDSPEFRFMLSPSDARLLRSSLDKAIEAVQVKAMTDAEIVEQALRRIAATMETTTKYYLIRVADEIVKMLAERKP
jgi:hypothetical protein